MHAWYDTILEILSAVGVAIVTFQICRAVERQIVVRKRLNAGGAPVTAAPVLRDDRLHSGFLQWVQRRTSLNNPEERSRLRVQLAKAGFDEAAAPIVFLVLRYAFALGLPLLLIAGQALLNAPANGLSAVVMPLVLCLLGLMLPGVLLKRRIASRRRTIEQQFPDTLDLLVICVDAGLSLEAAMMRVTKEMRRSHPEIAREFEQVSEELNAGRSQADALHNMAKRVEIPAIRGFVSLLVQSQALGASIAQGLKTYAIEMRNSRALQAEEKAMRIPVLISMPLVACFLPVIVEALLLPSVIDVIRVIAPAMKGG